MRLRGLRGVGCAVLNDASVGQMQRVIGEFADQSRLVGDDDEDRKSTRLNSSHIQKSRMPSSA